MGHLIAEIIAFLVIIFIFWRYIVPPVRRMMRQQQEKIDNQAQESEQAKAKLAEAERKHADAVEEARVEAAKIRDNARADAVRISEEMRAQAESEVEKIRQRGEDQIRLQRQQMVRQLRAELGGSALSEAKELVREHLSTQDAQREAVDRFLGELEGMSGTQTVGSGASSRGEA